MRKTRYLVQTILHENFIINNTIEELPDVAMAAEVQCARPYYDGHNIQTVWNSKEEAIAFSTGLKAAHELYNRLGIAAEDSRVYIVLVYLEENKIDKSEIREYPRKLIPEYMSFGSGWLNKNRLIVCYETEKQAIAFLSGVIGVSDISRGCIPEGQIINEDLPF
jgi:hypothetical protein